MTPPLPQGPFDVLYADPPWSYDNIRTGGSLKSGAAQKYPTMTMAELIEMGKHLHGLGNNTIARDAVCFMWATAPLLPEGIVLLERWGFRYKTTVVWHKVMSQGLGFWFRGQVEFLLLGVRGKVPPFRLQESNHVQAKVEEHSRKPEVFRQLIERATDRSGLTRRLELFARGKPATGWTAWGNEVDGKKVSYERPSGS